MQLSVPRTCSSGKLAKSSRVFPTSSGTRQTRCGLPRKVDFLAYLKKVPRIAGVNIPENKQIEIALTYIYGIGRSLSRKILNLARVEKEKRASELTSEEINRLKEIIEKQYKIEGELKREIMTAIRRLRDISCWRGIRHIKGLPVRGQRTRTNTRTIRGNVRKTVGSGRKPPPEPT